jgi:hypothetical protein
VSDFQSTFVFGVEAVISRVMLLKFGSHGEKAAIKCSCMHAEMLRRDGSLSLSLSLSLKRVYL